MKKLFLVLALLLSTQTNANGSKAAWVKISRIQFWRGHSGILIVTDNNKALLTGSCGRSDRLIIKNDNPNYKEIYTMLLLAKSTNQKVHMVSKDICVEGFNRIDHVMI